MIELIKIFLLAKVVLLTPSPVTFYDDYTLLPEPPIKAVNSRAHIIIDVTTMIPGGTSNDINESFNLLSEYFPAESIMVELSSATLETTILLSRISYAVNAEELLVYVMSESNMPKNLAFDKVTVKTDTPLSDVKIYWRNHMK